MRVEREGTHAASVQAMQAARSGCRRRVEDRLGSGSVIEDSFLARSRQSTREARMNVFIGTAATRL
jgi:hypothetical protein